MNILSLYRHLPIRVRDSVKYSYFIISILATILAISGLSLKDLGETTISCNIFYTIIFFIVVFSVIYILLGFIFKKSITLSVGGNIVEISHGDIFESSGLRVIGCDANFNTKVDDIVISKKSLHGKLILEHGIENDIIQAIQNEAKRLSLKKTDEGKYDFPLGSIIPYESATDGQIYLLLSMTKLDSSYKAHTDLSTYESTLIEMWKQIDRIYSGRDIVLPLLGDGITRFNDGPVVSSELLRCMLCTLYVSRIVFKAKLNILLYNTDFPLYEYKNILHSIPK